MTTAVNSWIPAELPDAVRAFIETARGLGYRLREPSAADLPQPEVH